MDCMYSPWDHKELDMTERLSLNSRCPFFQTYQNLTEPWLLTPTHQLFFAYLKFVWVDFPGGPVAKTPCSQCRGPGFNRQGTRPHMLQQSSNISHATAKTHLSQTNKQTNKMFKNKKRIYFLDNSSPKMQISVLATYLPFWRPLGQCSCQSLISDSANPIP